MERQSAKIALFVLIISGIVWLGAINIRALVGNELVHIRTLQLRTNLDIELEREVFRLISYSSLVVLGGYLGVFLSALVFLRTTSLSLKADGWLLMSAILFFMFSPVEFYTLFLDAKLAYLDILTAGDIHELRRLLLHRVGALAGVPLIALLCYYTIIGFTIWRPLRKQIARQS